jgi:hypothetical protein
MTEMKMEFEIGQKFEGEYPPEAAAWCEKNGATIRVGDGDEFEIVPIPMPTEEEMKAARLVEISNYLASTDRLMLDECVSKLIDPNHSLDFTLVFYRETLQHFTELDSWWTAHIESWEAYKNADKEC